MKMKRVAQAIAAGLFLLAVYRAATQSIVHDEALTWYWFVATPLASLVQTFDANHHILHTFLVRMVTAVGGVSELTMRIPALGGAALLLWTLVRLGSRLFGETWLTPALVVLAGASPLVLDFSVAARGYGLGLAFLFVAIDRLIEIQRRPAVARELWVPGAAVGLAVASNLAFAVPGLALMVVFICGWRPPRPAVPKVKKKRNPTEPARAHWLHLPLASGLVVASFALVTPVSQMATMSKYYVGSKTFAASLADLGSYTLGHNEGIGSLNAPAAGSSAAKQVFGFIVYPGVILGGLILGWRRRTLAGAEAGPDWLVFITATAVLCWAAAAAGNLSAGILYPADRTGLYHVPLFALALTGLASSAQAPIRRTSAAVAAALIASFAVQLQTSHFMVWRYDADTRALVEEFNRLGLRSSKTPVAGVSWVFQPAIVFYQETRGLKRFEFAAHEELRAGLDVYMLSDSDAALVEKYGLKIVRREPRSKTIIAKPDANKP